MKASLLADELTVSVPTVMSGHWQKEVPAKDGYYWTATRQGLRAGLKGVFYDEGRLCHAGGLVHENLRLGDNRWRGWWWSEPVVEPTPPAAGAWEETP